MLVCRYVCVYVLVVVVVVDSAPCVGMYDLCMSACMYVCMQAFIRAFMWGLHVYKGSGDGNN